MLHTTLQDYRSTGLQWASSVASYIFNLINTDPLNIITRPLASYKQITSATRNNRDNCEVLTWCPGGIGDGAGYRGRAIVGCSSGGTPAASGCRHQRGGRRRPRRRPEGGTGVGGRRGLGGRKHRRGWPEKPGGRRHPRRRMEGGTRAGRGHRERGGTKAIARRRRRRWGDRRGEGGAGRESGGRRAARYQGGAEACGRCFFLFDDVQWQQCPLNN